MPVIIPKKDVKFICARIYTDNGVGGVCEIAEMHNDPHGEYHPKGLDKNGCMVIASTTKDENKCQ